MRVRAPVAAHGTAVFPRTARGQGYSTAMPRVVVLGAGVCGLASAHAPRTRRSRRHRARARPRAGARLRSTRRGSSGRAAAWPSSARRTTSTPAPARCSTQTCPTCATRCSPPAPRASTRCAGRRRASPTAIRAPATSGCTTITGRRPIVEYVLARAADEEPRVEVRRGAGGHRPDRAQRRRRAARHRACAPRRGRRSRADLVVDAGGRRSALPRWLGERRRPRRPTKRPRTAASSTTRASSGPSDGGGDARSRRRRCCSPLGTFSVLTLPGDAGTWSVTIYIAAGDRPLKRLRDEDRLDSR